MASTAADTDLLTTAEAANLLNVSPVTISRWVKQGRLTAYRIGPRVVRIRRGDLEALLHPASPVEAPPARSPVFGHDESVVDADLVASLRTLTKDEIEEQLAVLEDARRLQQRMLARRGGRPLPSSWRIINQARDERSEQN